MISFIFAVSQNGVIGNNNQLPWNLPTDKIWFKNITKDNVIIMGRKTYESLPHFLYERENIILTRNQSYKASHVRVFNSLDNVLSYLSNDKENFVIGGAEIFKLFMPYADKIYMTKIYKDFDGDTYLPKINFTEWKEINKIKNNYLSFKIQIENKIYIKNNNI